MRISATRNASAVLRRALMVGGSGLAMSVLATAAFAQTGEPTTATADDQDGEPADLGGGVGRQPLQGAEDDVADVDRIAPGVHRPGELGGPWNAEVVGGDALGQHQVVVKNLESNYRKVPNVSGATILGDGTVALILDTGALVRRARH